MNHRRRMESVTEAIDPRRWLTLAFSALLLGGLIVFLFVFTASARPPLGVRMDSAEPRRFPTPYGYGVGVTYSLESHDPELYVIEGYDIQVDEGKGEWRTTHRMRESFYRWANIHGKIRCCPDRYNLPSGATVRVRARARYHLREERPFPDDEFEKMKRISTTPSGEESKWTSWSTPIEARVAQWKCTQRGLPNTGGPYFHNIYPWDHSPTETGVKILLDVPPEPPWSAVEEYVVKEGDYEVGVFPANRTDKFTFAEIDDYPLDPGTLHEYTLYARFGTYRDDEVCTPNVGERVVLHLVDEGLDRGGMATETMSRRTRYEDGVDAREAALRHRPLLVFDASEIYWPISIDWMLKNADLARFYWSGGPMVIVIREAGEYGEENLMAISHEEQGIIYYEYWEDFHLDARKESGLLLDYPECGHPQYSHMVDSNNANHTMGLPPVTLGNRTGCQELLGPLEWYYDCHFDLDDGRDLWDMGGELTPYYRAPNPKWKLYYTVYPYDANRNGEDDEGEYEIVYQMWNAWDAAWEDGDSGGMLGGATEFVTKHEGDQTTIRVYTSDHGKAATYVKGGMHGMDWFVRGEEGDLKQIEIGPINLPVPQVDFKFYGRSADEEGNLRLENIFLYQEGGNPYEKSSYQPPRSTFKKLRYWDFDNVNPEATHPVMFIAGRSHGASPIPGVLMYKLDDITKVLLWDIDAWSRDAFTGTGMRWLPTEEQLVPLEIDHSAFFHYIGWTGHWDYQDRLGKNPGWLKVLTPPHSPYNIMGPRNVPSDLTEPKEIERVIFWVDDARAIPGGEHAWHGPRGPFAWEKRRPFRRR